MDRFRVGGLRLLRFASWFYGTFGAVAQLVARFVRIEEVRGSIPLSSTIFEGTISIRIVPFVVGCVACPTDVTPRFAGSRSGWCLELV